MTRHLIIGGGPAATNAIETIRQFDGGESQITLISDEPAHSRMALPYWLAGQISRDHTLTGDAAYFERLGVEARIGRRAVGLDASRRRVTLDNGEAIDFDDVLIATGSSPLVPNLEGLHLPGVFPLWTLEQTESVLQAAASVEHPRVALIGAGFVGFLVLGAMFKRGWSLTVVEREPQVLPRMLDAESAKMVAAWLGERHVPVHLGVGVQSIQATDEGAKSVVLNNGQKIVADIVILATGVGPNVGMAADAGIEIDRGILVDDHLRTSQPFVYAAGDVAQGPVRFADQPQIHAIQPTAVDHGRVAGANMAGGDVAYPGSLLMNVVDVCGLQCASFGNWNDSSADVMTVCDTKRNVYRKLLWTEERMTGAIFIGRADDMGMLSDVGMVKGILQTELALGKWKAHLRQHPFDVRRAYIGAGVPAQLVRSTLLGRPASPRRFPPAGREAVVADTEAHRVLADAWERR